MDDTWKNHYTFFPTWTFLDTKIESEFMVATLSEPSACPTVQTVINVCTDFLQMINPEGFLQIPDIF